MPTITNTTSRLHLLLERISSLFRSQMRDTANEHGLKLVQLEVLVYLSVANRYSNTAGSIVDYLSVTKGTVSQTIRALERRGLLEKVADAEDGRVLHCLLTEEGSRIAGQAHPGHFLTSLRESQQQETLTAALSVLFALQMKQGFRSFGQCRTCRYFQNHESMHQCGLTGEGLSIEDSEKICWEHEEPALS